MKSPIRNSHKSTNLSHTIMAQKSQPRLPQLLTYLSLNPARNTYRIEGPVSSFDAIERPTLAFFDEVFVIRRVRGDELRD